MDGIEELEEGEIREKNEIEVLTKRVLEMETQALMIRHQVELEKVELEKAIEVYKIQYDGLCVVLEVKEMEFEDLILRKNFVDNELKAYKATCERLKQRVTCLEELRMKELEERENYRDFECGERREMDEVEVWKKWLWEFENGSAVKRKNEVELEKKLEICKTKCDGLSVKLDVHEELNNYRMMCDGLEERISRLNEDRKVMYERENRAQERINYLEKEFKKKECDQREKYVELWIDYRDLARAKRRVEDDIDVWKKKFGELETQAALKLKQVDFEKGELEKQLEECRTKCHGLCGELEENKMKCVVIEDKLKDLLVTKVVVNDELKAYKTTCKQLKELIMGLEEGRKVLCENEKKALERISYLEEETKNKECNERDKYAELMMENKDLECAKRNAENEIKIWKKRCSDLETGLMRMKEVELEKAELEKEFEVLLTKYDEFSMELDEKKKKCVLVEDKLEALMLRKKNSEDELKEYKRTCSGLKERIMGLEEEQKVIFEKEKRAQDRITYLEEKIKQMEGDEREKYAQLKKENKVLECGKRRAEEEIKAWKKMFRELEARVLRLEEENSTLKCMDSVSQVCGQIEQEPGGLQREVSYNDKREKYRNVKLQNEMDGRADCAHGAHLKIKETMSNNNGMILTSSFAGCHQPSSLQQNKEVHVTGSASNVMQSKPVVNVKEEKETTTIEFKMDIPSGVSQQLLFELEGISAKKLSHLAQGSVRPASGSIVENRYCENQKEITPKHTCNISSKETVHVSTDNTLKRSLCNEKDLKSQSCLKRLCSDQRGEEYGRSCEEDIPWSSNSKRRASIIVTSENESEDDDRIPISKLVKKLEETKEVHKLSPLNLSARNVNLSSEGKKFKESISPSKRRLISLRQCEEKKKWSESTSHNELTFPNHLQISGTLYQKAGNPISENGKENVVEDVGLHSESENLDQNTVEWSDTLDSGDSSSDSEDECDVNLDFNQVIAMITRNRLKESKWQFEADMLSSFEVDSELCMKAVCSLYRQQIFAEKLMKGTPNFKNQGFNKYDALRGATIAEFLMDGDRKGDLKKSLNEFERFDPKALEECKRLAIHYSKQLFSIYQNRGDPFFLPS